MPGNEACIEFLIPNFTQTNTCGTQVATVASGKAAGCTITVIFTPAALYSRSARLNITDDAIPTPQSVALLGTGVQVYAPTISPLSLTFSNQPLNKPSVAKIVKVNNNDPIFSLSLNTSLSAGDYQLVPQPGGCTTSLLENSSCVIGVTFTPTAPGARAGALTISSNASSIPVVVPITDIGGATAAVSPTFLDLGKTNLGQGSTAQPVTLTNTSAFPVNISGITMGGAGASEFVATNNCGTIVSLNSNCSISIAFRPNAPGTQTAFMTIASDAATPFPAVALQGTGTTPVVSLSTLNVVFPDQALKVAFSPAPITLTNSGTGLLNFSSSIALTGAAAGDFTETDNCGLQVLAGTSCVINVKFAPSALNSRIAVLTFADDAANSPQVATLGGNGINGSGVILLAPASVGFGNQQVKASTPIQTVTLTNSSTTSALTISSIKISGANASDFVIGTDNCPAVISASAKCHPIDLHSDDGLG